MRFYLTATVSGMCLLAQMDTAQAEGVLNLSLIHI